MKTIDGAGDATVLPQNLTAFNTTEEPGECLLLHTKVKGENKRRS